ncbi:MAG: STAS-like domain-containing protein [Bacteroidales bacterium]|nr:STAS-like domain-containing protein [Bacteroidales bacterium]
MYTIKLCDIVQGRSYPDAGRILYEKMVDVNNIPDKIILDMDGIATLPTIFLNVSIGQYIDSFGVERLKSRLSFSRISASQAERITNYILVLTSISGS